MSSETTGKTWPDVVREYIPDIGDDDAAMDIMWEFTGVKSKETAPMGAHHGS